MAQLIDKSALVAEIKKLEKLYCYGKSDGMLIAKSVFDSIKNIIDILEVKEVDLDFQRFAKEMDAVFALPSSETKNTEEEPLNWEYAIAKHFYELGMQVSNKAQKGE